MADWFRSIVVLLAGFVGVAATTLVLAGVIVPNPSVVGGPPPTAAPVGETAAAAPSVDPGGPVRVGGTLAVSGDRSGSMVLDRETIENRYGLVGDDATLLFGGDPITVERVQFDGLEIFVEPGSCSVEPGERDEPTGIVMTSVRCAAIEDVRGNGTIDLDGRVGLAATLFGMRGDLPPTGGTLELDGEPREFPGATFWLGGPFSGFVGQINDTRGAVISFRLDVQTHAYAVDEVQIEDDIARIGAGDCSVADRELGLADPHTRVLELTVECRRITFASGREASLHGSLVVDMIESPD